MHSENMSSAPLPQSFLLSIADDMVRVFQNLITILSGCYEDSLSSHPISTCIPSLEIVQFACGDLQQKLAVLWPCEKQYVAVLGCTGCGKSTLLNLMLSMMCPSGGTYTQGIRADSVRAVLRDTARVHFGNARSFSVGTELQGEDASMDYEVSPSEAESSKDYVSEELLNHERVSLEGLLGICCAQDRRSYMSMHICSYDDHPFILQNGRMGGAGTTKVTSVEYGPKFAGHIRWMTRKKMRRKLRDLRQILDRSEECAPSQEQLLLELKEFWVSVRQLVNLPSSAERPTEEQINLVIDDLGSKQKLLDKEEIIKTNVSKGCTADRVFVREGIKKNLGQQFGKLVEDLRIEVPIASFEGGVSLLDVPGTNDPRVLHQRETRDAIDRTSLILLVLDKSVMDKPTEESLAESPLLERMLMDETAGCSLVVVGIAEKDTQKGQSPKDVLAGFDSKENVPKSLKKVFQKIASRLCKSKRIQKERALQRIQDLFTGSKSITVIPVLPFLCASLHLSPSNPELHQRFCESVGKSNCPLRMSKEELRERCLETNIPHLLEKVHSVRVPPTKEELSEFMTSTVNDLALLLKSSMVDSSYVEFLEAERAQAHRVSVKDLCFKRDKVTVNIEDALLQCVDECKLEPNDINEICETVGEDVPSQLQAGRFTLGPFILRGFCPEVVGQKANILISSAEKESKRFTDLAYEYLFSLRGNTARLEAGFEKMEGDILALAVGLHDQLSNTWKLSLHRLRAKCFCGGIDGGLLGHVREALRKAYDGALKYLSKELKKHSKSRFFRETLRSLLEGNVIGAHAGKVAKVEVDKALDLFWKNLSQSLNEQIRHLWNSWQVEISNRTKSALNSFKTQKEQDLHMLDDMKAGDERFTLFQGRLLAQMVELEALKRRLDEGPKQLQEGSEYGYSLLQSDSVVDLRMGHKRKLGIIDCPRAGGNRSSPKTSGFMKNPLCLDIHGDVSEGVHSSGNQASKKDEHLGSPPPKLPAGASSPPANINKLGSFIGRSSRKAQVLSEAESFKLQKRESFAKRIKK